MVSALQEITLAGDFVAEASVDIIGTSARAMLASVTSRRALWLKPWVAAPASKTNWCKIPYDRTSLFGEKLHSAILKVTGGKSGLIASDKRPKQLKNDAIYLKGIEKRGHIDQERSSSAIGRIPNFSFCIYKNQNPLSPEINKNPFEGATVQPATVGARLRFFFLQA